MLNAEKVVSLFISEFGQFFKKHNKKDTTGFYYKEGELRIRLEDFSDWSEETQKREGKRFKLSLYFIKKNEYGKGKNKNFKFNDENELKPQIKKLVKWIIENYDAMIDEFDKDANQNQQLVDAEERIEKILEDCPIKCRFDGQNVSFFVGKNNYQLVEAMVEAIKKLS